MPGDWLPLPSVFPSSRSSKTQDCTTPGSRDGQSEGVTCLCIVTAQVTTFALAEEHRPWSVDDAIGHERSPLPRVQPAEVAARQSTSTDTTEKIENRHEHRNQTRPKRTPVEPVSTLSRCVCPDDTLEAHPRQAAGLLRLILVVVNKTAGEKAQAVLRWRSLFLIGCQQGCRWLLVVRQLNLHEECPAVWHARVPVLCLLCGPGRAVSTEHVVEQSAASSN